MIRLLSRKLCTKRLDNARISDYVFGEGLQGDPLRIGTVNVRNQYGKATSVRDVGVLKTGVPPAIKVACLPGWNVDSNVQWLLRDRPAGRCLTQPEVPTNQRSGQPARMSS